MTDAEFVDTLGISDVDGGRWGVPGISSVGEIEDIGDGTGGGINVIGGGSANVSVGFSASLSGVVASARVSPMVRVITEGDLSDFGPISTSPPCSIRVCIADKLRCDPDDDKAPLPLLMRDTVLDFTGAVSMIRGVAGGSLGTGFTILDGRWLLRPFGSSSSPKGGRAGVRDTIACDPIPSAVNIRGIKILNKGSGAEKHEVDIRSSTQNVDPFPTRELTPNRPPLRLTICLTRARPRPVPLPPCCLPCSV